MKTLQVEHPELCNFDQATHHEWLVTNGIGGFACGTLSQAHSRRYHGHLVAALHPPLGRTLLVSKLDTTVEYGGNTYTLFANELEDGSVQGDSIAVLQNFRLENQVPVWTYAFDDAVLELRVWMKYGENTTFAMYSLTSGDKELTLRVNPLCTYRDYHWLNTDAKEPQLTSIDGGLEILAREGAFPYRLVANNGQFHQEPTWTPTFRHRIETERGLDDTEQLFSPGHFELCVKSGDRATVTCSTEKILPADGRSACKEEQQRANELLTQAPTMEDWLHPLILAADQFVVARSTPDSPTGKTVIAGYPWFSDWGRDTMIALPGLTLSTGRPTVAADILRTFARHISQGMLPNRFPDEGENPEYNTVDATLWYFQAIHQYLHGTKDTSLIQELYPALRGIIDAHFSGTRYNIKMDERDGLLFAGEEGAQLTWMDAKVDDWVVTPRTGKPVEINALWYSTLRIMSDCANLIHENDSADEYARRADQVQSSFQKKFWFEDGGYLYDVIDSPEVDDSGRDASIRPNQLFAVSLPYSVVTAEQAKGIVDVCTEKLWTPCGLRSLAPTHPSFIGDYGGDQLKRDGCYHQGTVWGWLLGPFVTAHFNVYQDAEKARSYLDGIKEHLSDACIGSVSEIFDGNTPHAPRGCFAQAWSVAEVLRSSVDIGTNQAN